MGLESISTMLPLALASGVNLYATILIVGLSLRLGWVERVPAGLEVLASWPVLAVAGLFYAMEFLADKIPFVDNLWDAIHTFIRPLGAALIGAGVLSAADPEIRLVAALVAGGVALTSHSGKAGSRVALNVVSPAENISNTAVSLAEDIGVGLLVIFALNYPLLAAGVTLVILALIAIFLPRLLRWVWFTLRALAARLRGLLSRQSSSDQLPETHQQRLPGGQPELAATCVGQGLRGANGRQGYLALLNRGLYFTYDTLLRGRVWQIGLEQVSQVQLRSRALIDVLEVQYRDAGAQPQVARFVFLKDRAPLARQFAERLGRAAGS